jgi:hypothetical protein
MLTACVAQHAKSKSSHRAIRFCTALKGMASCFLLPSPRTKLRTVAAERTPKRALLTRTNITRPQQRRLPTSRLKSLISETSCPSGRPPRPIPNAHHVHSRTSPRTIIPGPSTRSRNHPIPRQLDISVSSNHQHTHLRLRDLIALAMHLRSALAPPHLCLTHLHLLSATHYRTPLRLLAHCRRDTTRIVRRMELKRSTL